MTKIHKNIKIDKKYIKNIKMTKIHKKHKNDKNT